MAENGKSGEKATQWMDKVENLILLEVHNVDIFKKIYTTGPVSPEHIYI